MFEMPVFYGRHDISIEAIMIFPNDWEKASKLASYSIASSDDFREISKCHPDLPLVDIAEDVAWVAENMDEVKANYVAGSMVGAVVAVLWRLICIEPKTASWKRATQAAANIGRKQGWRTARSTFAKHRSEFRFVLHLLWGAGTARPPVTS
jgi:hypothetical protein